MAFGLTKKQVCLSVYLYFVSKDAATREQLCRYLDTPKFL